VWDTPCVRGGGGREWNYEISQVGTKGGRGRSRERVCKSLTLPKFGLVDWEYICFG